MNICSVDDCTREIKAREFCNMHYQSWRKENLEIIQKEKESKPTVCYVDGCETKVFALGFCVPRPNRSRMSRGGQP